MASVLERLPMPSTKLAANDADMDLVDTALVANITRPRKARADKLAMVAFPNSLNSAEDVASPGDRENPMACGRSASNKHDDASHEKGRMGKNKNKNNHNHNQTQVVAKTLDANSAFRKLGAYNPPPAKNGAVGGRRQLKKTHSVDMESTSERRSPRSSRGRDSSSSPQNGAVKRKRARSESHQDDVRGTKYPVRRVSLVTRDTECSDDEWVEVKKFPASPGSAVKRSTKRNKQFKVKNDVTPVKLEKEMSNPVMDEMWEDEKMKIKRAMKRGSTPDPASPGYKAYKDWVAMKRPTLNTAIKSDQPSITISLFTLNAERNLQTLYHLVRAQLSRGHIFEAIQCCHNVLNSGYEKAEKYLSKLWKKEKGNLGNFEYAVEVQMNELREKIAGMWCLYAHVFLQIPETDLFLSAIKNRFEGATRGLASLNLMEEGLWDQALAILSSCVSCPFVGNHAAIALSLSRLRLRQRERGILRPYGVQVEVGDKKHPKKTKGTSVYSERSASTTAHWKNNLACALAICKAGIERSAPNPTYRTKVSEAQKVSCDEGFGELYLDTKETTERVVSIVSKIISGKSGGERKHSEGTSDAVPVFEEKEFFRTLDLPRRLEAALRKKPKDNKKKPSSVPYLFADRSSTRLLLMETNCLDRLKCTVNEVGDDSTERLVLVCDPERLKGDPQELLDYKVLPCVDGVVWNDCLYFQSMCGVFVEESTARKSWYLPKQRLSWAVHFFRAGSYHASDSAENDEEINGFAKFPSDPVYFDVTFPCPVCGSLLGSAANIEAHAAVCAVSLGGRFRQDTLRSAWEEISPTKKTRFVAACSRSIENVRKYFDCECVCKDCCVDNKLYINAHDLGEVRCWRPPPAEPANVPGVGNLDELGGDHAKDECASMPMDLKRGRAVVQTMESLAVSTSLVTVAAGADYTAAGNSANPRTCEVKTFARVKKREKMQAGARRRKSSQSRRSVYANLTTLFDDEAAREQKVESDNEGAGLVPSAKHKGGAVALVNSVDGSSLLETFPPLKGKKLPCSTNGTSKDDKLADVEYPCRTCRQSSFLTKKERDEHENCCKGPSGGGLVLEERWPTFPSNHGHSRKKVRGVYQKAISEGSADTLRKLGDVESGTHEIVNPRLSKRVANLSTTGGVVEVGSVGKTKGRKARGGDSTFNVQWCHDRGC